MFSFIILHYKNIDETIECLHNLKKIIKNNKASIIVVDNNTLTTQELLKIKDFTKDIIVLDKNYGFAIGNNKGIEYAKKKYNPDFYCVINNDVFIEQENFIAQVQKIYKKYKFDMLGPKIDSPTGESINPFPVFKDKEKVKLEIKKCKKLIKIYNSSFLTAVLKFYLKIKKKFSKNKNSPKNGERAKQNVALHGCAIIFSKKYIEKYDDPFCNKTFLFHEEEFLYQRVLNDNLISIYEPSLHIFHKEGSSVKKNYKKERLSKLFREETRIKSLESLLELMQGESKNE